MKLKLSKTQFISLLVAWALLLIAWPSSTPSGAPSDNPDGQKAGEGLYKAVSTKANFGMSGVRYYESSQGRKHWYIESKFAELHKKENYAFLTEVKAQFFAKTTGNTVTTQSDYGRSWTDKDLIELEGHVSIQSQKGYLFEMDKMNYTSKKHEFTSEDFVKMRGPDIHNPLMLLSGTGLEADIDREEFLIKKNVVAEKKIKNSKSLKIRSQMGQFFTHESRSVFIENVVAKMPDTSIECDIMELSLNEEQESIAAQGSVRLINKGRIATAETALIELGGTEIILEGKAKIDSEDNVIEGRRIKLFTDDDRIEVEEASGSTVK